MATFEGLVIVALVAIIALIYRLDRLVREEYRAAAARRDRTALEQRVRERMPTLWGEPDSREHLLTWFRFATSNDDRYETQWHWAAVAERLRAVKPSRAEWRVASIEAERLSEASLQLFREMQESSKLTDLEIRYLLFKAWYTHFRSPSIVWADQDIPRFEQELQSIRAKYLSSSPNAT